MQKDAQGCRHINTNEGNAMPTMIRPKGIGKKIAFSILGIPSNMMHKKTQHQKERDDQLYLSQSRTSSRIF